MKATGSDYDARTYRWVALTLRAGMYSSFAAMGGGLLWWLLAGSKGGKEATEKSIPLDSIFPQLLVGNPLALLNLGVVVLLATPGITLLTGIVSYAVERNWRYTAIGSIVAAILLLSIALSLKWIRLF